MFAILRLEEILKERHWSWADLSRKSNVSTRTLENIRKRGSGRHSNLVLIANSLDLEVDDLFSDEERPDYVDDGKDINTDNYTALMQDALSNLEKSIEDGNAELAEYFKSYIARLKKNFVNVTFIRANQYYLNNDYERACELYFSAFGEATENESELIGKYVDEFLDICSKLNRLNTVISLSRILSFSHSANNDVAIKIGSFLFKNGAPNNIIMEAYNETINRIENSL